ncbi:MAG: hypothetical protein M1834_007027 [Cirrosporium novae-zelandiae]|nr:MAG: hypothetical protein M1834_007027 [Cirrosporium novae-zelandiae]
MPTLVVVNFNIVSAVLGGFITLFGLVSYLLKERYYLSEALISLIAGIIFSPHATNFVRPLDYAGGSQENLELITLYFTRLVLGVQLVLAGVQLPSKYLLKEWKSLSWLLGPGMTAMWLCSSLLVWAMVPNISFLHSLAIGACVTPTDPVLSNSIVKGKFADKNIPKELQKIIIAESGANDGLGYPFLFLPLYLMKYIGMGGAGQSGGAGKAIGYWFGETWGYTILLSVAYGAVVGYIAKELLRRAEERKFVDRESFLVFAIALAVGLSFSLNNYEINHQKLFIVGTCGMIGSDDVLACFIAGNTFTIERIPAIFAMHKFIKQIDEKRQALFVGFFGPIGVSAVFYLYVSLEFFSDITVDGDEREDAAKLGDIMRIVIWFLAICSIVVHGISIPIGKFMVQLPRTISMSLSTSVGPDEPNPPFRIRERVGHEIYNVHQQRKHRHLSNQTPTTEPPRATFRIGRPIRHRVNSDIERSPGGSGVQTPQERHVMNKNPVEDGSRDGSESHSPTLEGDSSGKSSNIPDEQKPLDQQAQTEDPPQLVQKPSVDASKD